jgi:UDP-2,3-diacylglucosamine hydrolase
VISAWFLSDLHLKDLSERRSQWLLRFLLSLANRERPATHLYLVGDIFDLWVGDHDFYERKFQPLIDAILACQKIGIQVTYFEGNHDVHVKKYWENRHRIPCYIEEKYERLGSMLVRIEHGDLINPNDEAYLKYRGFIRRPFMEKVAQWIPARIMFEIGDFASRQSRKKSSVRRRDSEAELCQMIRDYAVRVYEKEPFDLLITGHMHIRDDWSFERDGKKIRSVNLGSWFEEPLVFHLEEGKSEWVSVEA